MSFLTPEQKASAAKEEALLAAKHGQVTADQKKKLKNQEKNGKMYAEKSAEMKAKTGRSGRVKTFRKCSDGEDPRGFTLKDINEITYMTVQYFINTSTRTRVTKDGEVLACGSGKAANVLKICWSTESDPNKAKMAEYQTQSYYNLYKGYGISGRVKKQGPDYAKAVKEIAKEFKSLAEFNEENPLDDVMYGQCTVQVEKAGTVTFPEFNVWFVPTSQDGKNKGVLYFNSNGVEHHVLMHDVSKRENRGGAKRAADASKMIGFLPKISTAKSNEILTASLNKLKNKDAE